MSPYPNSDFKILVVDDDPDLLQITRLQLNREHYFVSTAASGKECMQAIERETPDLLLLDVMLPDSSGIDICKTIKTDPELSSIHVLLLSGMKTQSESISEGLETGADGYMVKPLKNRELLARVHAAFRIIQGEKALKVSEGHYHSLVEGIPGIVYSFSDRQGGVYYSQRVEQILGYSPEQLYANPMLWHDSIHPDDLPRVEEVIRQLPSGKTFTIEYRIADSQGKWLWLADRLIEQHLESGEAIITGLAMDITERKQAEDALHESEKRVQKKLNSILSGESHLSELELSDIIDTEAIQSMMLDFYHFTDVPVAIIDLEGKVLVGTGWQDICKKFHRVHPETLRNCIECDTILTKDVPPGVFKSYLCKNNLWDNVTPLIVGGKHVGNLFTGQYFYEGEKPDDQVFRAQAAKYGFNETDYMDAVNRVPVWKRDKIQTALAFYTKLANMISSLSHANLVLAKSLEDRKLAKEELQKSFDLLNHLTAQVPGVVYQYRLYPDGHSAFPFSSPGMFDIYEVLPEEVREDASPVFTRIHPDDFDMIVKTISESARNQTIYHSEFRVILPKQGLRWRLCDAKPALLEDGSTLWYGIISDITDRKQAEQELRNAKEKAEESDRLKSAFLANMSHEIRTPMNGILGFAELLKEPGLTGEEQQKYIRIIEKSGARMLNIIHDIIDISKIESGQMEVSLSETNLNEQIKYIYDFFKPEAERKRIQLSCQSNAPSNEAIINTDKEKVYAILTNLVKNAIKYTNEGLIEFGYTLNIAETQNGQPLQQYRFFVKDTGAGIPKDRQGAIFERFVQADIFDKQALQGAGLGLSISKAYAEMLGGKIWVESEPAKGSTFYFTVPCL